LIRGVINGFAAAVLALVVGSSTLTAPPPRTTTTLQAQVEALVKASGAQVGISLVELDGSGPLSWSYNGDQLFVAASTYKLPLLMAEAQLLARGAIGTNDLLFYTESDWEDGWYDDYVEGDAFTRQQLAGRVGQDSDNTAAHMLVASLGGGPGLETYAAAYGAVESSFWDPNETTANDLARLWRTEAAGQAGGGAAQQWLYPLLTHTAYESGIPTGVGAQATVVHKIGILDGEVNDAALVLGGPRGAYVLTVMTDGPGGDAGWALVSQISQAVWRFELS
jgi:beta-lactamase class A